MMPLQGVRIADFTRDLAGAFCPCLLGQLGAEVIKIESTLRPDPTRSLARFFGWKRGLTMEGLDSSMEFCHVNLNKLSVTLDLNHPKGMELARRIVAMSDVAVDNFRPGVMKKLGLDYELLSRVRPGLIMLSTCGWGATGPERSNASYAPIFATVGGLSQLTGYDDMPPPTVRTLPDATAAGMAAFSILTALVHRQATGEGQYIDFSSVENIISLVGDSVVEHSMTGVVPGPQGNRDESMVPHGTYRCQGDDRWVSIAVADGPEWQAVCHAVGHPEWLQDARYSGHQERLRNREKLDLLVEEWTLGRSAEEATAVLQGAGVAAVPVYNNDQLCQDPHLREREYFTQIEHPVIGKHTVFRPPWLLSETPAQITSPGPLMGEHNNYVLGELLGLSGEEIEQLAAEKVLV
jgi:crotonobetainyl-CoA:carnitine CoA-transferase CaiB-like acyl-CoA transferase